MEYASAENHEAAAKLAHAMYEHVSQAALGGLPFADVVTAVAMLSGLLLAGAYSGTPQREIVARNIARAAVEQAGYLAKQNLRRVPYGAPAGTA